MTTLGQLVEHVRHNLSGADAAREAVAATTSPVGAGDLTIPVDGTEGAAQGVVEVGFEQMRVRRVDHAGSALLLYPFGRGYRGTKARAHPAGSEVRFNPDWPAGTVAREINGVLTELGTRLYVVRSHETVFPSDRGPIDVPDEATGVIGVFVEDRLVRDTWVPETRWVWEPDSTGDGRTLRVGGAYHTGDRVRVVYATRPGLFDLDGDLSQGFEETTGYEGRLSDLLALGVAARLAPFLDVSKLPHTSAEARSGGEAKLPGHGASAARLVTVLFRDRVDAEVAALNRRHPIRVHWSR